MPSVGPKVTELVRSVGFAAVQVAIGLGSAGCAVEPVSIEYELKSVFTVEGRQGIATDGRRYFVSGSTA